MDIGADCQSRRDPLADCSTVLGTQLQHEEPARGSAATAKCRYALVLEAPTAGPDLELVNASGVAWKQASVSGLVLSGHKRYWYPPPWLAVSWNRTRASLPLVHTCAARGRDGSSEVCGLQLCADFVPAAPRGRPGRD